MAKDSKGLALLDEIHDLGRVLTKFCESDCLHLKGLQEMPALLYNVVRYSAISMDAADTDHCPSSPDAECRVRGGRARECVASFNNSLDLMNAARKGRTERVQELIEVGADVNELDQKGFSALMLAAYNGHTETVKALLKAGADVNRKEILLGYTALLISAQFGHTEIVEALIEAKANINAKDNDGLTALMLASHNGHIEIVRLLIKAGAENNR